MELAGRLLQPHTPCYPPRIRTGLLHKQLIGKGDYRGTAASSRVEISHAIWFCFAVSCRMAVFKPVIRPDEISAHEVRLQAEAPDGDDDDLGFCHSPDYGI